MFLKLKTRRQRGDTIVEVMLALAVLGFALGISYSTANHSLLDIRQAQENSQATEYVQSQIEDLRYLAASNWTTIESQTSPYCITNPSATPPTTSTSTANCSQPNPGSGLYTVLIYSCDAIGPGPGTPCAGISNTTDTFVVQAQWPDVEGQGTDSVTMAYRVHQSS